MTKEKAPLSHLDVLKAEHSDFDLPKKGERKDYPEDIGDRIGDSRHFGLLLRKYTLVYRFSNEDSALEYAEKRVSEGKQAQITYNPIRFETYGVWIH